MFASPTQSGFFGGGVFVLARYGTKLRNKNGNGISVGGNDKILDILKVVHGIIDRLPLRGCNFTRHTFPKHNPGIRRISIKLKPTWHFLQQIRRFWVFGDVVSRAAFGSRHCPDVSCITLAVGVGEVGGHGFIMLQSTLLSRTEEIHYFEELVDFFLPFFI